MDNYKHKQNIEEILETRADGKLIRREGQTLEFKENFNFNGMAEYLRDFAAFANNKGGYLVFGVKDRPRRAVGIKPASKDQFDKIDPEMITGFLLDCFTGQEKNLSSARKMREPGSSGMVTSISVMVAGLSASGIVSWRVSSTTG